MNQLLPASLLIAACSLPCALAQEKPLTDPIRISMLAVGDPPQPRFDVQADGRRFIGGESGEYPPGSLLLKEKSTKGEAFKELSLGLNTPTGYITYQGESVLNLFRGDDGQTKSSYASLSIPKLNGDLTILLTRDPVKKSWASPPLARFLDNGFQSFPPDSARFVNLSTVPIRILTGQEKLFELLPGAARVIRLQRSEQGILTYRIAAAVSGKIFPLSDTATTYTPDSRINLVAYNADGDDRSQPVKVIRYFERPPEVIAKKD